MGCTLLDCSCQRVLTYYFNCETIGIVLDVTVVLDASREFYHCGGGGSDRLSGPSGTLIFLFVSLVHVRLIVEKNLPKKFATSQIGPLTHYPAQYKKEGSDRNSIQSIQQIILTSN